MSVRRINLVRKEFGSDVGSSNQLKKQRHPETHYDKVLINACAYTFSVKANPTLPNMVLFPSLPSVFVCACFSICCRCCCLFLSFSHSFFFFAESLLINWTEQRREPCDSKIENSFSESNESINSLPKCHIYWITINTWMSLFTKFISYSFTQSQNAIQTQNFHSFFNTSTTVQSRLYSSSLCLSLSPSCYPVCIERDTTQTEMFMKSFMITWIILEFMFYQFVPYQKLMRIVWIKSFVNRILWRKMGCKVRTQWRWKREYSGDVTENRQQKSNEMGEQTMVKRERKKK